MAFKLHTARQALVDALAIDWRQKGVLEPSIYKTSKSKKQKTGTNLKSSVSGTDSGEAVCDRVYAGKVMSAIPKNKIANLFASYLYGPTAQKHEIDKVLQYVYFSFCKNKENKNVFKSYKHSRRLNDLIMFAAVNYKVGVMNGESRYQIADMCEQADIDLKIGREIGREYINN